MGITKRRLEEQEEGRFSVDQDIIVCVDCFENYAIKEFIKDNDTNMACSYCETENESCSLHVVMGHIMCCIHTVWSDPANVLPYETREGGWQGNVYDSRDIIDSSGLETNNDKLREYIISSLSNDWCDKSPYSLSESETLLYGWKDFSKFVKTEARNANPSTYYKDNYDMHPVQILEELSKITKKLNLIKPIKKTTEIYRVRIVKPDVTLALATELGSPPLDCATVSNRMSPAGISMFYGAFDDRTAILETYNSSISGSKKVVAKFLPTRDLIVLDLSELPPVPCIFDSNTHAIRPLIMFITDFMEDFTKPISRDDKSHISYVPTQIVTEYFRHIFRTDDNLKLDGIMYPSSKQNDDRAVVLFADNKQCVEKASSYPDEAILFLDSIKYK